MAKQTKSSAARPKPGPRPAAHRSGVADHGTRRRRTAHRPTDETKRPKVQKPAAKKAPVKAPVKRVSAKKKAPVKKTPSSASIPSRRHDAAPASVAKWWLLAGLVVVLGFVIAVVEAPFFEARTVQISGISRTSEGAVLEAIDLQPDKALLFYNTSAAAELVADLPWVRQVEVTRQWPSTVRIVVRERTVAAAVGTPTGSRWMVVSEDGMVVEERLTPPTGVPIIVGTAEIVQASRVGTPIAGAERALDIAGDLPLQLDPWITTWTTDADGRVTADLVGSAKVEFGAFEDHRTQFVSLASILDGGAPLVCLQTIDLSVADSPVLHRNPQCLLQARELTN